MGTEPHGHRELARLRLDAHTCVCTHTHTHKLWLWAPRSEGAVQITAAPL